MSVCACMHLRAYLWLSTSLWLSFCLSLCVCACVRVYIHVPGKTCIERTRATGNGPVESPPIAVAFIVSDATEQTPLEDDPAGSGDGRDTGVGCVACITASEDDALLLASGDGFVSTCTDPVSASRCVPPNGPVDPKGVRVGCDFECIEGVRVDGDVADAPWLGWTFVKTSG